MRHPARWFQRLARGRRLRGVRDARGRAHEPRRAGARGLSQRTPETIVLGGGSTVVRVLVAEESTTLLELELAPGSGAGSHVHSREDEAIAVLEGELAFEAEGERRVLRAGEAVFVARGTEHGFANDGAGRVRAHVVCAPGGLERFFRDVARAGTDEEAAAAAEHAGLRFA